MISKPRADPPDIPLPLFTWLEAPADALYPAGSNCKEPCMLTGAEGLAFQLLLALLLLSGPCVTIMWSGQSSLNMPKASPKCRWCPHSNVSRYRHVIYMRKWCSTNSQRRASSPYGDAWGSQRQVYQLSKYWFVSLVPSLRVERLRLRLRKQIRMIT